MSDEIKIPARVLALAEQIGDIPLAWNEHEDGSIVIVFNSKGKQAFEPEKKPIIHTKADAVEAVATLTPKHEPKPKRK
jgi:hypothetical protein